MHRVETAWFALSLGAIGALGQSQKSESASSEARGGRGLGTLIDFDLHYHLPALRICRRRTDAIERLPVFL